MRSSSEAACSVACVCVDYQAEVGLQLDLQGLQGPLELRHLAPGALEALGARGHVLVQFIELEDATKRSKTVTNTIYVYISIYISIDIYYIIYIYILYIYYII